MTVRLADGTLATAVLAYRIRQALRHDELTLHLQPQVSLISGHVEAVEALVRWRRPRSGLVLPGEFIEQVRRSGLARRFDSWVLRAAVGEAAALRDAGHPLRVAVNMAPCSLADPALAGEVATLLSRYELPPEALEIEVTEHVLDAHGQARATLSKLARLGVATALDDFGVGFSSLTRLASLPFTTLKIDRSLVTDVDRCPRAATVFSAAVRLAHDLGLEAVVEGVETLRTWGHGVKVRAERAQGWLIAPALPRGELLDRLGAGALAGPVSAVAAPRAGVMDPAGSAVAAAA
jgi:EAL domain-containing protein (putative c-di-GMP-specific phosphodiesterase class I)